MPTLDRVGLVGLADMGEGRGSTGSPTARHVRRALDVGLDFSLPFYQEKGRKLSTLNSPTTLNPKFSILNSQFHFLL